MTKKRKKYPRLPNGYGSIKYLGDDRRNPYGVYPPTKEFTLEGVPKTQKALCYVDDWMVGFAVLTAYRAGTFTPEMVPELEAERQDRSGKPDALIQSILADYDRSVAAQRKTENPAVTFSMVYKDFYSWKYEQPNGRQFSNATKKSTNFAYSHCAPLYDRPFAELRHRDLQAIVDDCPLKHASKELIVTLFKQMYAYAETYEIVDKDYSAHVRVNQAEDETHGEPFTEEELEILWRHQQNETVEMILIMCYSGYRISAYQNLEVNLSKKYFRGGVKTAAGKDRIVPIHSGIFPLVERRIKRDGGLLVVTTDLFRRKMMQELERLHISKHTPHSCRHTFSALCEKYEVKENDRKRMLGHSFQGDVTNGVYGHRTVEELRIEIEKIKIPVL